MVNCHPPKTESASMEKDIAVLKSTVNNLQKRLSENDELLKKCMYNEQKYEIQIKLMEGQLTTLLDQKIFNQFSNLNQKFNSKFDKVNATLEELNASLKRCDQSINDEDIIRKPQLETIFENKLSKDFEKQNDLFKIFILASINSVSGKQEENLRKQLTDLLIGHLAIKETELEGRIEEKTKRKTDKYCKQLKTMIETTLKEKTAAYEDKLQKQTDSHLKDTFAKFQKEVYKYVDDQLKEIATKIQLQLNKTFNAEISKSLEQKKKELIKTIKDEMDNRIRIQLGILLTVFTKYLDQKMKKHKEDILTTVLTECSNGFYFINEELKICTENLIYHEMEIQKYQLIQDFEISIARKFDLFSDTLHNVLSQEFESEMKQIENQLQAHTELWQETKREVQALDTKFVEKIPYLLRTRQTEFTWEVAGISNLMRDYVSNNIDTIESHPFVIQYCGLEMIARLKLLESGPVLFLGFAQQPLGEKIFYHRRTILLLDQSENNPPADKIRISEPHFSNTESQEWMTTFTGSRLFDSFAKMKCQNNYIKDDKLIIKVLIHPLSILYQSYHSNNGILLWKIEDFAKKMKDERNEVTTCLMSDYFYSSKNGYRLQVQLTCYTRYITVQLVFLRGEWDEFLPKYYRHKTTVTLLDQSDSLEKDNFEKSLISNDTYADSFSKYYLKDKLASSVYLKNDSIQLRVKVEADFEPLLSSTVDSINAYCTTNFSQSEGVEFCSPIRPRSRPGLNRLLDSTSTNVALP